MFNTYVEENDRITKSNYVNDNESVQSIITKQDKVQWRLKQLKEGTKTMFKEFEEDYDLINDRIHRLESDMQNLQSKQKSHTTRRKLDYHKSSDSDDSSISPFPFKPRSNNNVSSHTPPTKHYLNMYYRGPNID